MHALPPSIDAITPSPSTSDIWWSNGIFFVAIHVAAVVGVFYYPPPSVPRATLVLAFLIWQLSFLGITVGYHRLFSHRAFKANFGVKLVLVALGSAAFQGSVKWWCLRHRLHHRYTDDPIHDPYAATRGLLWSHMGWIFRKPVYERMKLVDREDLNSDPILQFQHDYYIPIAFSLGFVLPTLLGLLWADAWGSFIWGGLVARIIIWHCVFFVNSLAHWEGFQPYSDEDTSRGNFILALLTAGEGSHNFHHAFPYDFRAGGPSNLEWDPSKWVILVLHYLGWVTALRRAREQDVKEAAAHMSLKHDLGVFSGEDDEEEIEWKGEVWKLDEVEEYVKTKTGRCVILLRGMVVDVTSYLGEHPGGAMILRKYAFRLQKEKGLLWTESSWAFDGGLNHHTRAARRRMREMRLARFDSS